MNDKHELKVIISGHFPLITIQSHEEMRSLSMLRDIAVELGRPMMQWSISDGLRREKATRQSEIDWSRVTLEGEPSNDGKGGAEPEDTSDPEGVLRSLQRMLDKPLVVLLDFHPYLGNPKVVRLLKEIAIRHYDNGVTVVLLSHQLQLPSELERLGAKFELSLPDTEQIKHLIRDEARLWETRNGNTKIRGDKEAYLKLARVLTGLTVSDVKRLVRNAIYDDGAITHSDIPGVMQAKYQLIGQDGLLAFEYDTAHFSDVGGFNRLKGWLDLRKQVFIETTEKGMDQPKGILLLGVQGGGKSLAAKAVAGSWGLPLLRMDFGALYTKYLGESEKNLRKSLQAADAMAPCVLWIDEIEKGISGSSDDDGTSRRILGTLLTWMAEQSKPVFVVATANDVQSLPPELIRKGRLDEIFFVDLPDSQNRKSIFRIHLAKRGLDRPGIDLTELAQASDGFSGAEIEQAVVAARFAARGAQQDVSNEIILAELKRTRPLSIVMAEQIAALRQWAKGRTVTAG